MRLVTLLLFLLVSVTGISQIFEPIAYPKGYFRNPLNIPIDLAGNFGELRPNHFHMGLDLKTQHRENLPVYAAADGYIAKIKIEPGGFGRAIYINHPNGYTTVYGHLNAFIPALDEYIKVQQYKMESWKVFLDIPPNLFPVKKGDFIARSGNTGGSEGAHLHFEIRKTDDDINRNPMLFGLPLPDDTKPTISRLAIYDRRVSTYEQSPQILLLKNVGNTYLNLLPLQVDADSVSFGISASDTHTGSVNPNGIYEAILYDNNKPVVGFQMDKISYNNTRNVNAHIDYKTKANGGPYLQQLFELPGYKNSIYKKVNGNGTINLRDGVVHHIKIEVKDAYNNTSSVEIAIQYKKSLKALAKQTPGKIFYPFQLSGFESDDCEFYIGEKCLYDSVHITYRKSVSPSAQVVSAIHSIGAKYIPLQDAMTVRIKPTVLVPATKKPHVVMQCFNGKKQSIEKVVWQKDVATASFREMGNFQLVLDESPPVITSVGTVDGANLKKASRITFVVSDNLDAFGNFRAELDGKWLRFSNDKGRNFIYVFDEKCTAGEHVLKVSVEDLAGNVTTKSFTFTR